MHLVDLQRRREGNCLSKLWRVEVKEVVGDIGSGWVGLHIKGRLPGKWIATSRN